MHSSSDRVSSEEEMIRKIHKYIRGERHSPKETKPEVNDDDLEDLLNLLPKEKISIKRLAINITDSRVRADCKHLPLQKYLDKHSKISTSIEEDKVIYDAYHHSNIISVKAPWAVSPNRNTVGSAFSNSVTDNNNKNDNNNGSPNDDNYYDEDEDFDGSSNNDKKKEKNELDDYLAMLGSDSDTNADTNAYSFSKIAVEKQPKRPQSAPYWPNSKIKLTTLVWVENRKKPKFVNNSPKWV